MSLTSSIKNVFIYLCRNDRMIDRGAVEEYYLYILQKIFDENQNVAKNCNKCLK